MESTRGTPRRVARSVLVAVAVFAVQNVPAMAHTPTSFTGCSAHQKYGGDCRTDNGSFSPGQRVVLRGHVIPAHSSLQAQVWCKRPKQSKYVKVGTVGISDHGRMRWFWHPTGDDVYEETPYRFYFKIVGHGRSNLIRLYVVIRI